MRHQIVPENTGLNDQNHNKKIKRYLSESTENLTVQNTSLFA